MKYRFYSLVQGIIDYDFNKDIYDNYEYSPGNSYDCIETIFLEQGNPFREIDLTILNPHNMFSGVKLEYPFYRYSKWKEMQWFENKDIEKYIPRIISTTTLIISKKPGNTGISRDIRTEFTTDLLLSD